jgi:signal peptidase I
MAAVFRSLSPARLGTAVRFRPSWALLRGCFRGATAVLATLAVAGVLFFTVLPRTGLYATYILLSDSMQPTIPMGSIVIVAPVSPASLVVGDVISYTSAEAPYPTLTHRIQSISREDDGRLGFVTKGDYNLVPDPYVVHYSGTAGLVIRAVPYVGYAIAVLESTIARLVLGMALAGMLAFFWFRRVWTKPVADALHIATAAQPQGSFQLGRVSPLRIGMFLWLVLKLLGGPGR